MAAEPIAMIDDDAASLSASLGALTAATAKLTGDLAELKGALVSLEGAPGQPDRAERRELVTDLRDLLQAQEVLAGLTTQIAGQVEATAAWREQAAGARDFSDWLSRTTRHGAGAGRRIGTKAKTLEEMPLLKDAATTPGAGLTDAHLSHLARVFDDATPASKERIVSAQDDVLLLAKAKDAASFGRDLRARVAALEADAADGSFEQAHQSRFLRLISSAAGVRVEGRLDPVAGETVRRALEALSPVPAAGDERTGPQRSADALTLLAERALSYGEKKGALNRPHLTVLIGEETLIAARSRQRLQRRRTAEDTGPSGCAATAGSVAAEGASPEERDGLSGAAFRASPLVTEPPLAQLEDGTGLPPAALEVLLCDAEVQRLVLDTHGQPLDVGQRTRSFTRDLRVAILVRDRHCIYPGCTLRASWCQVHHLQFWSDEGATELKNGVSLCGFHHHRVHAASISIRPIDGGFLFVAAGGHRLGSTTRYSDRLLAPTRHALRSASRGRAEPPGVGPPGERGAGPPREESAYRANLCDS